MTFYEVWVKNRVYNNTCYAGTYALVVDLAGEKLCIHNFFFQFVASGFNFFCLVTIWRSFTLYWLSNIRFLLVKIELFCPMLFGVKLGTCGISNRMTR